MKELVWNYAVENCMNEFFIKRVSWCDVMAGCCVPVLGE